ncbi:MAG: M20/M25/M40 family metallo-hydrolase, partial [Thermococcus sp.]|nr:M20/M25/M40 family metallo-hydrolase [Thermococcus sp.]
LPYLVRENNRFVSILSQVYSVLWGRTPEKTYGRSVGDFNYFGTYLGVPTIVFGPIGGNWHSSDEWVRVSSVKRVKETYLEFLRVLGSNKRLAELVEMKDYAPS